MRWLAKTYVNALKIIHYMHDKYDYEAFEMALHDGDVERTRATGIAGLSIVTDSIAAMKNCKVRIVRDENGLADRGGHLCAVRQQRRCHRPDCG